jgi:hypothetical protein
MCTSFAVYAPHPIYGMNFDYPDVEVQFRLEGEGAEATLYMCLERDGQFMPMSGVNARGLFAAAQILVARSEILPRPDDDLISPYALFSESLRVARHTAEVVGILGGRRMAYTPQRRGHQLYADSEGHTLIVEPGVDGNVLLPSAEPYTVMTNFPNASLRDRDPSSATGCGADRFRIACDFIAGHPNGFGFTEGLEMLRRAALHANSFKTQSSWVLDPIRGEAYIVVQRDFARVWRARFAARTLETFSGFCQPVTLHLTAEGVLASQMAACI